MIFKIGDRVRDWDTGDIAIIMEYSPGLNTDFQDGWWVLWETGEFAGQRLWLSESQMTLVENNQ